MISCSAVVVKKIYSMIAGYGQVKQMIQFKCKHEMRTLWIINKKFMIE